MSAFGAARVLKAKAPSSATFIMPMAPPTDPHIGSAPANRSGARSASPMETMPPMESPQAMTRLGLPNRAVKAASVAS